MYVIRCVGKYDLFALIEVNDVAIYCEESLRRAWNIPSIWNDFVFSKLS